MEITCCGCNGQKVKARLTYGHEIYPHRKDLYLLPFWKCDTCGNFVGCHHKTKNKTKPLGCIPTPEIKQKRLEIHRIIDPLWKLKKVERSYVYNWLSRHLGYEYHTANIESLEEAEKVLRLVKQLKEEIYISLL